MESLTLRALRGGKGALQKLRRVFVYGTLMKDCGNYKRYLKDRISRITPGYTEGLLYHLPEGYPALLEGDGIVKGEIMEEVDEKLLRTLDRLEDYAEGGKNNLYERKIKTVFTAAGERLDCWVYVFSDEKYAMQYGVFIPDGDWRNFIRQYRPRRKRCV